MSLLASRLQNAQDEVFAKEMADERKNLVGSGDRSERNRSYNLPQGSLSDHRINLTLYRLNEIMEGELDDVVQPLVHEHQADLLASLST
jgi:peptide chain release factor 1